MTAQIMIAIYQVENEGLKEMLLDYLFKNGVLNVILMEIKNNFCSSHDN